VRNISRIELLDELSATRSQTLELIDHLQPQQWAVPHLETINPPLWEIGHIGWVQEFWCNRYRYDRAPRASILLNSDEFYDSNVITHASRWTRPLPDQAVMREYLSDVLDMTLDKLRSAPETDEGLYFFRLALFHEKMHVEALVSTWHLLDYTLPTGIEMPDASCLTADIKFSGGVLELGSNPKQGFVFDNEKWGHIVDIAPFEISTSPLLNSEFLSFVNDGGYRRREFWDTNYFAQLQLTNRSMPLNWHDNRGRLSEGWFGHAVPIDVNRPLVHVSAFEAEAFCRWAERRLPTEAEWEYAATHESKFEWGDSVWEWTASDFNPFAGFVADPYKEYSEPWFGNHRVVKGGSFATPRGIAHPKFRNFYIPERNDIFVGFRTCAL
jgi:gamma-glutamyl hercynylcysteine S-oxide synthase